MISKNLLFEFVDSDAMARILVCMPTEVEIEAIRSLWPVLPNLADNLVSVNDLAQAYNRIMYLWLNLFDMRGQYEILDTEK